ncbi:MAG: tetratricopeptide repeat protein, partial [Microcystis sp.]
MSLPLSSILVTLSLGLGFVSLPLPVQYLPVNAIAQVNSPSTAQDFLDQGVKQLQQGDLEAAINNFNEAIRLNPNYAQAYGNRGIVYSRLQQYEKALADYNQYIRFNPNSAEAYYNRATLYDKLGDYQKAIADYDRAIRLNPNFSQAISNREIAYNKLGKTQQTSTQSTPTSRSETQSSNSFSEPHQLPSSPSINPPPITRIRIPIGIRVLKPISFVPPMLVLNPTAVDYYNHGLEYQKAEQYEEALAHYNRAIHLNPKLAPAYLNRGAVYDELKQYQKA